MKTYHYIVKGLVQGVNFRFYTLKTAQKLNVKGSVRNLFNGDVEVHAQGDKEAIKALEEFLNVGPFTAKVDKVVKEELDDTMVYTDFDITY
jgi:acylphosphatase